MAKNNTPIDKTKLTKRQASVINRGNRSISGNINSLMDDLNSMTYGISRTDKIDALTDDFNTLLKGEIASITKATEGDTTSFITKLFSENNKRMATTVKDIESMFSMEQGQLEEFIGDQYRNRLIKHGDLHEVTSQLVELQEAITITRDAIISSDVIEGRMSRDITLDTSDFSDSEENYIPIVEKMEDKFDLQKKIKNFIIPKTLEYGEYYAYCIPYSKIFEDFSKEKSGIRGYQAYQESQEFTLLEFVNNDKKFKKSFSDKIIECVKESADFRSMTLEDQSNLNKSVPRELEAYLENITICNSPIPLPVLEEGVDSQRQYYTEFVEKTMMEADDREFSFDNVMKNIDTGVHSFSNSNKKNSGKKKETFADIKDCYLKLIDPNHLLPIQIMNETIGYYYIQEDDISTLSGILTSTVYYSKYDDSRNENNILSQIAETIVTSFDKKFLENNAKFKKLIVEALNYYKLNNRKLKFQYIPKEYIIRFAVNEDENGNGRSIIEPSLFYAKLYLMLLLFKIISIIMNSNDMKVNYIRQSGIEKNVMNKIQEIARKKQQRQITMTDLFSYTTLVNKIGQGSEMYIPVGKSNERGIETEILSGQEIQLNSELLEMLKKAYISGTGVPDVLLNYLNEAEFAKTLELANNRFHGNVVSYQLDFNKPISELYKMILTHSTTVPQEVIDSLKFSFVSPKYHNSNVTNDLLNNYTGLQDFLIQIYFGQEFDDPDKLEIVKEFKKKLAEERLPMINFRRIDEIFKESNINGTEKILNPESNAEEV